MTLIIALGVLLIPLSMAMSAEAPATAPWAAEKASQWYRRQPWLVGCNFLPSTAVNNVEMWQAETFDAVTIDRELAWAKGLGFNTVRIFINYIVWEADAAGLKQRLARFLEIAERHSIRVMPILFDDCFKPEPAAGKQDDPMPGVHNSQWVMSPGKRRIGDKASWPMLEKYVKDVVGQFANDGRIVIWDLYNEPQFSLELVESTFRWAREAGASQPLTTCIFGPPPMRKRIPELCDIVSFHNYSALTAVKDDVERLSRTGRPVICTEWMARTAGSRFETHLPFFKERRIGCWNWGLVAGRTQTYYPWGSKPGSAEPPLWFHDILRQDGRPFDAAEAQLIRRLITAPSANPAFQAPPERR